MDPDWSGSPPERLRCLLCNALLPRYAEPFFRHLIEEHKVFKNLNILFELSVGGGVWLPPSPPPQVPLLQESPSPPFPVRPKVEKIPWPWNPLEEQAPTSAPSSSSFPKPATSSTLKRSAPRASNSAKVRGSEKAPKEGDCKSHDACSDGQCSSQDPSILCSLLTTPTFSLRDPIAHFQPRQHLLKRTREELVKRNNRAKEVREGPPNRNIVTEELQRIIVTSNQGRDVHFTKSQRDYIQMVLDGFILKKKKGPVLCKKGLEVVSWRCTVPNCHYTAITKDGVIFEGRSSHSHSPRPDLVVKKDVYAKVRDLVSLEDRVPLVGGSAASLVKEAIVDQGADIEGQGAIGLDAMTQAARRYRRRSSGNTRPVLDVRTEDVEVGNVFNLGGKVEKVATAFQGPEGDSLRKEMSSSYNSDLPIASFTEEHSANQRNEEAASTTHLDSNPVQVAKPCAVEFTLNPTTLEVSLVQSEVEQTSLDSALCQETDLNTPTESSYSRDVMLEQGLCDLQLAGAPGDGVPKEVPDGLVNLRAESVIFSGNKEQCEGLEGAIKVVDEVNPMAKHSSLVNVSDFTEDSDNVHEEEGGQKNTCEGESIEAASSATIEVGLEEEVCKEPAKKRKSDFNVKPSDEIQDEIEHFDEKVARLKAKLDFENIEEEEVVKAVMVGLVEEGFSHCKGMGDLADALVDERRDDEKCTRHLVHQEGGNTSKADETDIEDHTRESPENKTENHSTDLGDRRNNNTCKTLGVEVNAIAQGMKDDVVLKNNQKQAHHGHVEEHSQRQTDTIMIRKSKRLLRRKKSSWP